MRAFVAALEANWGLTFQDAYEIMISDGEDLVCVNLLGYQASLIMRFTYYRAPCVRANVARVSTHLTYS